MDEAEILESFEVYDLIELITDPDLEEALRLDIAREGEHKTKMVNNRKWTLGQISDQDKKIERKLAVLHKILDVKKVVDGE
ncbi:hypothetical protein VPHK567_0056 [Vibrio phage K567]|nr:hypothetical protein MYOV011v1_p0148 [Vibrio phage 6E35.1a]